MKSRIRYSKQSKDYYICTCEDVGGTGTLTRIDRLRWIVEATRSDTNISIFVEHRSLERSKLVLRNFWNIYGYKPIGWENPK